MTPLDYDYLRKCLKEKSGLVLSADKQYLVESRLLPVARKSGLASLGELVCALKRGDGDDLMTHVVEAMTTNETFFFRDNTPFDNFRSLILPALLAARQNSRFIRIWCAAASTGQEPYSLAIIIKEMAADLAGWHIELVASDLSNEVLERARKGIYSQFEVQRGLPIKLLIKYFAQVGEVWEIAPEIRAMVRFQKLNLLSDFTRLGVFDVIFCRNVLIYFDQETKTDILNRLNGVIAADGYLTLGAAETVIGLTGSFRPVPEWRGLYAPSRPPRRDSLGANAKPAPRLVAVGGGR